MKRLLKTGLALGLLSSAMALPAMAQDGDTTEINEYRIESNDCFGCGPSPIFSSASDVQSYLSETGAILASGQNAGGVFAASEAAQMLERRRNQRREQVVFLDFDAGGDPTFPVCFFDPATGDPIPGALFGVFNDHVYTDEERDTILARIEADYGQFNFSFTQNEPSSGDFTTIRFGENDAPSDCTVRTNVSLTPTGGISILFGQAEGIDFLNTDRNDNAFADGSFWEFLAQLDVGLFEDFSGFLVADFDGDLTAAISAAVTNQSANTGAHEAGHIMGLRHQNSFGAPGDGLPNTGALTPFDFVPTFSGPSDADETVLHTMASGASVGLGFEGSTMTDRFFSERSAVRLALNEQANFETEARAERRRGRINLRNVRTPNTIIQGQNADARIAVKALVLEGSLDVVGEADSYFFRGREGDFFNAEIIPVIVTGETFEEGILGQISIYQQNRDGSETLIASNARSFESLFDTEIFDAVLPANAVYRVEVSAPDEFFVVDLDGDGALDPLQLSTDGGAPELLTGNYQVLLFTCDKILPRSR